jgi:hypothetical protein
MAGMRNDSMPPADEIAAALAAVRAYIEEDRPAAAAAPPPRPWHIAAALEAQGLPPTRNGAHHAWGAAERAARASRWSYGITGI